MMVEKDFINGWRLDVDFRCSTIDVDGCGMSARVVCPICNLEFKVIDGIRPIREIEQESIFFHNRSI